MRDKKGKFQKGHAPWNKGKTGVYSEERLEELSHCAKTGVTGMLGKKHSEGTKEKMSIVKRGKVFSEKHKKNLSKAHRKRGTIPPRWWEDPILATKTMGKLKKKKVVIRCGVCGKKFKVIPSRAKTANFCSKQCHNKSMIGRLLTKEWKEKMIKNTLMAMLKRPTSLEKQMIALIKKHNLPYKYVGDGGFLIGYKNPDFVNINGEKKLIEIGNEFHHKPPYTKNRRKHFAKYGWESYIFIGDELDEGKILKILGSKLCYND